MSERPLTPIERIEKIRNDWQSKPRWWHEVLFIGFFYGLYSLVRNVHGSELSIQTANHHAESVVNGEQALHIFHEKQIQDWFLPHTWAIKFFDDWYGTAHFIVPIIALLWMYHMHTDRYRKWRNVIFATTFFALIGYLVYPLAPPRLLPAHYGFVDTLDKIGGLWNFNNKTATSISNQYAAMPSLHTAWATWCAFALVPTVRRWWLRALLCIYPFITVTAIVVTANHYWFDAIGGLITLSLGYAVATVFDRRRRGNFSRKFEEARAAASKNGEADHDLAPTPFA